MRIVAFLLVIISSLNGGAAQTTTTSTATDFEPGEPLAVNWALCQIVGGRKRQEDAFCMVNGFNGDANKALAGVFDGHGGATVSGHVAQLLPAIIQNRLRAGEPCNEQLFVQSFEEMNQALGNELADEQGSTAVTALIDTNSRTAHVAWAGDARACLIENGTIISETKDHNPSDPDELARIKGNFPEAVIEGDEGKFMRLGGDINLSRGFGDMVHLENGLICTPETVQWRMGKQTTLLLCSDGLVDVAVAAQGSLQEEWKDAVSMSSDIAAYNERLEGLANYVCAGNCTRLKTLAKLLCRSNQANQDLAQKLQASNSSLPGMFPYDNVTVLLIQLAHAAVVQEKIQGTIVQTDKVPTQEFVNAKNKSWLRYLVDIVVSMGS